jgi:hypothetical protein
MDHPKFSLSAVASSWTTVIFFSGADGAFVGPSELGDSDPGPSGSRLRSPTVEEVPDINRGT